jgi:integrase
LPIELERFKTGWHSVQTVQRLYNWGVKMGLLASNPVKGVERPQAGRRERILSAAESAMLLRAADDDFRPFLLAQRQTIARPQEIRSLKWNHLILEPVPAFVLTNFKGKKLRKGDKGLRVIPLDGRMVRLLARLRARNPKARPDDNVFLNRDGKPWTNNSLRCRMRRLRDKVGLKPDGNGEKVVCYTLRHTAATRATANGVHDRTLADLMGHTSTKTTSRYQHLQVHHLHAAVQAANRKMS